MKEKNKVCAIIIVVMTIVAVIHSYNQSFDNSILTSIFQGVGVSMLIPIYFAPTIIGSERRSKYQILATNAFFGWTVIGWVVAFIWALGKDKE